VHVIRSARDVTRLVAASRSLGTISSSRCQTTRACKRPKTRETHCMREFISYGRVWKPIRSPPSPAAFVRRRTSATKRLRRDSLRTAGLPSRSRGAAKAGGARRNRTDDLLLAKQALSQLSYGPAQRSIKFWVPSKAGMVGLGRFELPTSRLSSARSNQLSYRPKKHTLIPRDPNDRGQKDAPTTFG
jgi:hypothetical protein